MLQCEAALAGCAANAHPKWLESARGQRGQPVFVQWTKRDGGRNTEPDPSSGGAYGRLRVALAPFWQVLPRPWDTPNAFPFELPHANVIRLRRLRGRFGSPPKTSIASKVRRLPSSD